MGHIALVRLDSLEPAIYIVLGLGLILCSGLARLAFNPAPKVAGIGKYDGGSSKVVPIDRYTRVRRRACPQRLPISAV